MKNSKKDEENVIFALVVSLQEGYGCQIKQKTLTKYTANVLSVDNADVCLCSKFKNKSWLLLH